MFAHPGGTIRSRQGIAPGIDIRGDGGFIVAAPSRHASGNTYAWQVNPADVPLPQLPDAWLSWLKKGQSDFVTETAETTETTETSETTEDVRGRLRTNDDIHVGSYGAVLSIDEFVEEAIVKTLPTKPGTRHKAVFNFARLLRSRDELKDLPFSKLRPIVKRWYGQAVARLGADKINADADANWADFVEGWPNVKYPGEGAYMNAMLERAMRADTPEVALEFETERARWLVALCRELQREAGDDPFYLPTTTVETLLGYKRMEGWRMLDHLCRVGILELVEKGNQKKANRYRYLAAL